MNDYTAIDKYRDIIFSDEFKEFIEIYEGGNMTEVEKEIFDEAKRLLEEYGDDFAIIRYSYIEEYEEELVRECYSIPESLNWLFYHIDWEGVVRDLTMGGDLSEDEFCGIKYYVEMR